VCTTVSVRPDALTALADELAALAADLAADADACGGAAALLAAGLGGEEGLVAAFAARGWGQLLDGLADGCRTMAGTLHAALEAYRNAEHDRAGSIDAAQPR
jgi:hypothetical protein